MKYLILLLVIIPIFSFGQSYKKGVRRNNKTELKIAAEAAAKYADGRFEIHMYGDTAEIDYGKITYKYRQEQRKNIWEGKINMQPGQWYWSPVAGSRLRINNYEWEILRDTIIEAPGFKDGPDISYGIKLEQMVIAKRICVCDSVKYNFWRLGN